MPVCYDSTLVTWLSLLAALMAVALVASWWAYLWRISSRPLSVDDATVVETLRELGGRAEPKMLCLSLMSLRGYSQEEAASIMSRCKAIRTDNRDGKLVLRRP